LREKYDQVPPCISLNNDLGKAFTGIDEQLNIAIEKVLKMMKTEPVKIPPAPPYPTKQRVAAVAKTDPDFGKSNLAGQYS
jgi:hypothetical protein